MCQLRPQTISLYMESVDEPEVIEIDDTFAPNADSPPGTEGRDENSQDPITAPGMEFVSNTTPIPKEGDNEVEPAPLREEGELVVSNDPLDDEGYVDDRVRSSRVTFSWQSDRASRTFISQMMTLMKRSCSKNRFSLQFHWR